MALAPGEEAEVEAVPTAQTLSREDMSLSPSSACRHAAPQPQPAGTGELHSELLALCGSHLALTGQMLAAGTPVPPEVAFAALSRNIETLKEALVDTSHSGTFEPAPRPSVTPSVVHHLPSAATLTGSAVTSRSQMGRMLAEASDGLEQGKNVSDVLGLRSTAALPGSHSSNSCVNKVRRFMSSQKTQGFFLLCICLNTVNMIVEEQYLGGLVGYRLGVYAEMGSGSDRTMENAMKVLEIGFAAVFTIEVVLLLIALRSSFWHDWRCVLDFLVVLITAVSIILSDMVKVDMNIQVLRTLRLTKTVRILRIFESAEKLESILVMAAALRSCVASACLAIVILFSSLTVFALVITRIVRDRYLHEYSSMTEDQQVEAFMYFGSYTRSMMSMFELALANWTTITRFLMENIHEWWVLFAILYKLTVGFAMIGILNSVFMQETFSATEMDNDVMVAKKRRADHIHRQKMTDLFEHADLDHDGRIGRREFARVLRDPAIRTWLSSMNLDISDGCLLFDLILAHDGDGKIGKDELIDGIAHLRGPARSIDVKALRRQLEGA